MEDLGIPFSAVRTYCFSVCLSLLCSIGSGGLSAHGVWLGAGDSRIFYSVSIHPFLPSPLPPPLSVN